LGNADKGFMTARQALWLANPRTWAASACPALFGVCYCWVRGYPLSVIKAVALTAACILLQSAVNTLNDYYDYVKGTDSAEDPLEASDAVLIHENLNPKSALWLGLAFLAAGGALGLACCTGAVPLLVGLAGAAVVVLYSAGPLPISYLPLGELISGVVMGGLIPLGIAGCADGRWHPAVLVWSLPLILGISLIMMTNNGCDVEKDRRAARRTLPALLGRESTVVLYRAQSVLWLLLLAVLPVLLLGMPGLIGTLLLALCWRRFRALLGFRLEPENRIRQMKGITAANLLGNGAYVAALAVSLLAGVR